MKKCFFLLDGLSVGGSEQKTIRASNLLIEEGLDVHLGFLNSVSDLRQSISSSIPVFTGDRKGKFDIRLLIKIRQYIISNDIDTVWAVNLYPVLYLFIATIRMRRKVRVIGSSNITVFRNAYENRKMRLYAPIIRRLDKFVFGSYQQMEMWKKKYNLNVANLDVIHNGVDTDYFSTDSINIDRIDARKVYGFDNSDIVIGMVAQFRIEKAHSDLLQACHILNQRGFPVKLLLVGSGDEMNKIRLLSEKLGISDKIFFAGQMSDVRPALGVMDIFALTSQSVETFSNATLEAMAMGLPAILSDLSGASEMVFSGENGYLYPPGDIGALIDVIDLLLDADIRKRCGKKAREIVKEQFSADAMADKYLQILVN